MRIKVNLDPRTLEEAEMSYAALKGSYMESRRVFAGMGEGRRHFLKEYVSSMEEHERLFGRLLQSRPVQAEYSKSLVGEAGPEIYECISGVLAEIRVEKSKIGTAVKKIPHSVSEF